MEKPSKRGTPVLYIIIPCYNEEAVLPITSEQFLAQLLEMINKESISDSSRIMFVDDGSKDSTWEIICSLAQKDEHYTGIRQSRNRGHQNAVLAGLMEANSLGADITISIDCDGQDDITVMSDMVDAYHGGVEIVYGVRSSRKTDSFFKRFTAQSFYKLLSAMGVEVIYNHADYRLVSGKALTAFSDFREVNLFLRGMFPLVGFKSATVEYERHERIAGKSHYPLKKMLALAFDGISSLSIKPIRIITVIGVIFSCLSFAGIIWSLVSHFVGSTVAGWTSMTCIICLLGSVQLIGIGIIGEYIGKIYMEVKQRPRYIISERTEPKEKQE